MTTRITDDRQGAKSSAETIDFKGSANSGPRQVEEQGAFVVEEPAFGQIFEPYPDIATDLAASGAQRGEDLSSVLRFLYTPLENASQKCNPCQKHPEIDVSFRH